VSALGSAFTEYGRRMYFFAAPVLVAMLYYFILRSKVDEKCGSTESMSEQQLLSWHLLPIAVAALSGIVAVGTEIQGTILYPVSALLVYVATEAALMYGITCLPGN
jgi:hypothetical protein